MKRLVNVLTVGIYLLSLVAISTGEVQAEATAKVKHKPAKYFVPEHRIIVNAEISDPNGVKLVRCYFKASAQADYVFVGMQQNSGGDYQGILPAPDKNTQTIEYLFLVLNNKKQVVKTQKFTVAKKDSKDVPSWQNVRSQGNIQVSTEVPTKSESLSGFKDSIAIDLVESSARLGLVAGGIYAAAHIASGGAAAAATSAGTVTASTGMSTATIAGVGAGVAAVGAIAALSGGGDDGGGCPSGTIDCNGVCKTSCEVNSPVCECGFESDGKTCRSCTCDKCGPYQPTNGSGPFTIDLKKESTFTFEYRTYTTRDNFIIYIVKSNGAKEELRRTECVGTGNTDKYSEPMYISTVGRGTVIEVVVLPNCDNITGGTSWGFKVTRL